MNPIEGGKKKLLFYIVNKKKICELAKKVI
jgi:hypothetical protein